MAKTPKPVPTHTPISKAVEPQRRAAVQKARDDAQKVVDKIHSHLAEHDWDLNQAAPRPHWRDQTSYQGQNALRKHQLYQSVTTHDGERNDKLGYADRNKHQFVKAVGSIKIHHPEKGKVDRVIDNGKKYVDEAESQAHAGYDAFIHKLHDKVGPHTSAELTGNHVWGYSVLHIGHADGAKQKWKTQQIFKLSKLGKPHNQWPTRKIK